MKKTILIVLLLFAICSIEGKKLTKIRSSSSSRGSSRKTSSNPQPTSFSHAQPVQAAAPKKSLFGWQEQPAQRKQAPPKQSPQPKQPQTHSYPSSNTGMSGGGTAKQPTHQQESVQRSAPSQQSSPSRTGPQTNSQPSHSYPASTGLSGSPGSGYPQQGGHSASGAGYPQQQGGLSGSGAAAPPHGAAGGPPPAYSNSVGYPKQQGTGAGGAPPPYSPGNYQPNNNYGNNYHQPPPPYSPNQGGYGGHAGYGGYGGYGGHGGYGHGGYSPQNTPQMPGYFGNYGKGGFGGVSRSRNILTGVGIAGAGVGTILTGLALWNLARSTGQQHHTVIYDDRGAPVAVAPGNSTEPVVDPILGDLVNCTLTISTDNGTEVLAIPCAIATSFTPEADVKEAVVSNNPTDKTKCTITVVTKAGREFMTTIPCSTLLNTAAENNVTEPVLNNNGTEMVNDPMLPPVDPNMQPPSPPLPQPTALPLANLNCTPEPGDVRDPINPCYAVTTNLTVIPLQNDTTITPPSA